MNVYANQVFSEGQRFVIAFEGDMLMARVASLEVHDTKSATTTTSSDVDFTEKPTIGLMLKSTEVSLTKTKTSVITYKNLSVRSQTTQIFNPGFTFEKLGIGGLDNELSKIFRRAFASRIFPPDVISKLGINHIRGILLYGPPGCGKTLMARQIGKMLNCHEPKIVNGPEILNKYVGQSEENIRKLFADAEEEWNEKKEASQLHLIIFDEIDAICKQRGTTRNGTGVNDSIVNQLLSKIDGVNSLNNVLIIGMTNRLDLIDEALLRPGRFEVQVEIGLPDRKGRLQILKIHTEKMRKHQYIANDVDFEKLADLTKNFSGAEIEGLVKSATSFALNRTVDIDNLGKTTTTTTTTNAAATKAEDIRVGMADFEAALEEVKPAFGVAQDEMEPYLAHGLLDYGATFVKLQNTCKSFIHQVQTSDTTNLLTVLLEGDSGSGKTTLAAHLAVHSGFPYVKIISPETMVGYGEHEKCAKITKVFHDAYKSPMSIIVLDNLERILEYVSIGPRFSNVVLQTILVLLKKPPPKNRKLLVFATTSQADTLKNLELSDTFNLQLYVPSLTREEVKNVLTTLDVVNTQDQATLKQILDMVPPFLGIKKLMMVIEMAQSRQEVGGEKKANSKYIDPEDFRQALGACGFDVQETDKSLE